VTWCALHGAVQSPDKWRSLTQNSHGVAYPMPRSDLIAMMTDEQSECERLALIGILDETIAFLRKHGVTHWPESLERSRAFIENRDFRGVEELFSIFGGMGSFNDVMIDPLNGHSVAESEVARVNDRFQMLKGNIYNSVTTLRRFQYGR
jgi:hypothetical protein